jgi:uncharacterized protein (TIGR02145 family)/uncharacterized repeat protein (TIGR02543 family)
MSIISMTCNNPANPYDKKNTKIYIYARSAAGAVSSTGIDDSVGNTIYIGCNSNLPSNIDSVQLVTSNSVFGIFKDISSKKSSDTLWDSIVFSDSGTKIITGIAYISNNTPYSSFITATIHLKPANHKPILNVTGDTTITVAQTCSLTVFVSDVDSLQTHSFSVLKKPLSGSFVNPTFTLKPSSDNIGKDTVIFMVVDNGYPPMSDTDTVVITVSDTSSQKNKVPKWEDDTINLSGSVGSKISLTLTEACSDPDGDTLTYTLLPGTPAGDTIINGIWSFTPAAGDTGTYYVRIIAQDPLGATDTGVLHVTVTAVDTTGPTVALVNPSTDTTSTNSSSYQIKLKCIDASGIASVIGVTGSVTDTGKKSTDSIYTITVSNLTQGRYDTVNITVTDNSARANKTRLSVKIKYDPTLTDITGPVITEVSGLKSGDTVSASSFTIVDSIFDPSGVDSVYATLNGTTTKTVLTGASDRYTYTGTWSEGSNTIVITAKDKSTAGNINTQTINVVYIKAPIITTQPAAQTACPGDSVTFGVKATGTLPLIYRWYKGSTRVGTTDSTSGSYKISSFELTDTGYYKVVVSNSLGLATSDSVKLYATKYTVTFNTNVSSITVSSQSVICGSNATQPTNPAYSGYRFDGWYTTSSYSTLFSFPTTPITSNITLYAKWIPVYTVTYNANGGTGTAPSDTSHYEAGDSAIVLDGSGLTKTNYAFKYWTTAANGSGKTYSTGSKVGITNSNVTLYAQWVRTYTITFDDQGATTKGSPSTMTVDSGSTVGSLPTSPSKTSYVFNNWYTGTKGTGTQFTQNTTVTSDATVYAYWVIKDYDGNIYTEVTIGTQTWMVENLRTTNYNDGTSIPEVTDATEWSGLTTGGYCYYNNTANADSIKKFGALYNWYAVNTGKLAPAGWHVPDTTEWNTLQNYLIANGYNYDGTTTDNKIAKSMAATTDWSSSTTDGAIGNDLTKNNSSGFCALPGGYRYYIGTFLSQSYYGYLWSATEYDASHAWYRYLYYDGDYLYRYYYYNKSCGFSVRLVRD